MVIAPESGGIPLAFTGAVDPVADDAPEEYWLHHVVACLLRRHPDARPGEVQDALLSYSNNALSNLFGVALFTAEGGDGKLRSLECAELCSVLGVPPERTADARMLHAALRAVPRAQACSARRTMPPIDLQSEASCGPGLRTTSPA